MGPDEEYLEAHEKGKLLLEKQLNRWADIKAKQQVLNPSPPTIKRDRRVRYGISEPPDVPQVETQEEDPGSSPGQYRNGHKGQITKAIALRRRKRTMAKASRNTNRRKKSSGQRRAA